MNIVIEYTSMVDWFVVVNKSTFTTMVYRNITAQNSAAENGVKTKFKSYPIWDCDIEVGRGYSSTMVA